MNGKRFLKLTRPRSLEGVCRIVTSDTEISLAYRFRSAVERAVDWLFGYDFFISYSQRDGLHLPREIRKRLQQAGFRVFLDQTEYVAGLDLRKETRRQVLKSRKLVIIGRPAALKSEWVKREVDVALSAEKTPVLVDINDAVAAAPIDANLAVMAKEQQWLRLEETLTDPDGSPTDRLINELVRGFNHTRQETKRHRVLVGAALILAVLAGVASWQAYVATQQQQLALSRQLAAQAISRIDREPDLALLLSVEACQVKETAEARDSLLSLLNRSPRLKTFLSGHKDTVATMTYIPDRKILASGAHDGKIILWDMSDPRSAKPLGEPLPICQGTFNPNSCRVMSLAYISDRKILASGVINGDIVFWDISDRIAAKRLSTFSCSPVWCNAGLHSGQENPCFRRWRWEGYSVDISRQSPKSR